MSPRTRKKFNVYIDESGDEGFASGATPWLVLAAVVVEDDDDIIAARSVNYMKEQMGLMSHKPIHWKERKDHSQRKFMVNVISQLPITLIYVCVYKRHLTSNFLRKPPALYLYSSRFLLERVTWLVDARGGVCNVVFEHRRRFDYKTLSTYISAVEAWPDGGIRHGIIRSIEPRPKADKKMLQIADIAAGACYAALAEDRLGQTEPSYILALRNRIYRRNGEVFGYGFKVFPDTPLYLAAVHPDKFGWMEELQ